MVKSFQDDVLSRTVSFLRFPLIVAVVFIHTKLSDVEMGGITYAGTDTLLVYKFINQLFTNEFARIAVPLFFFISGYFFFANSAFSWKMYGNKMKKRLNTLLIPYLFWNLLALLKCFLSQTFLASMVTGDKKLVVDYGWQDWLNVFWNFKDEMPADYPLWFIRDLMLLCLCAPLIYFLIRATRGWGVCTLLILYIAGLLPRFGIFSSDPFFFFVGAWFAIEKIDFTKNLSRFLHHSLYLYPLFVICSILCFYNIIQINWLGIIFHRLGICVGLILAISLVAYGISKNKLSVNKLLTGSTFFVFASHGLFNTIFSKGLIKFCQPITDFIAVCAYFIIPILVVVICVSLHILAKRNCPRFLAWITGGRT